jgi:hypothetical protein
MKTVMMICVLGLFSVGCGEEIRPPGVPVIYDANVTDDRQEIVDQDMGTPDLGSVENLDLGSVENLSVDLGLGADSGFGTTCTTDANCNDDNDCTFDRCVPYLATLRCIHQVFDNDHDGYFPVACLGNDCNDDDSTIHPGAAEICDEAVCNAVPGPPSIETCDLIDNDCDGTVDEDDQTILCRHYASPTISCAGYFGCAHNRYTGNEDQICVHAVPCLE